MDWKNLTVWPWFTQTKGERITVLVLVFSMIMAGCGGGSSATAAATTGTQDEATLQAAGTLVAQATTTSTTAALAAAAPLRPTRAEATRFLTQATFGPSQGDVLRLMSIGYEAWLSEQFAKPMSAKSHLAAWDQSNQMVMAINPHARASRGEVVSSFWRQAMTSEDQLRQRVAFALSEIFVVSLLDSCGGNAYSRGAADFLDMLGRQAFGSYRALLEAVALHPVMGCYLSHMKNMPEDTRTGRVPDENFAREIMQLFSIGLYELKPDGSLKLDTRLQPIETYSGTDISGLAKVFTGWSWMCPTGLTPSCFFSNPTSLDQYVTNMRGYALYHSRSEKRFLNTTIPASMFATPEGSLKTALDAIAKHPNVGPFIGKLLIQRLTTSNPSPAYIGRVSAAFHGAGGSMAAMVKAILLDPEARAMSATTDSRFGKVREPILRMSALMRAFGVQSDSGIFLITDTSDPSQTLGQSAMAPPSVFSFFDPGFMLPNSRSATAGLLSPELQSATEISAAGYVNYLTQFLPLGTGRRGYDDKAPRQDVQLKPTIDAQDPVLPLADKPEVLTEEVNQRLMYGTMPAALKQEIVSTLNALPFGPNPGSEQILKTRRIRLWSALLLTAASPEFQVQR